MYLYFYLQYAAENNTHRALERDFGLVERRLFRTTSHASIYTNDRDGTLFGIIL